MYCIPYDRLDISKLGDDKYLATKGLKQTPSLQHHILTYDKDRITDENREFCKLFRSTIFNSKGCVCFSPPKSMFYETFKRDFDIDNVVVEEFIEGTMINVFYDDKWHIATRNTVGGQTRFYKDSPTFYEMFEAAKHFCNLDYSLLDKKYCYSFILQHPKNRIVCPVNQPRLYLIAIYYIKHEDDMITIKEIHRSDKYIEDLLHRTNRGVWVPRIFSAESYEVIEKDFISRTKHIYSDMGRVFKSATQRTKYINPVYQEIKLMRGNHPKLQFQYLNLRKNGMVKEYLRYYRENVREFSVFRDQIHRFTRTLFKNYISCFIRKEKVLSEYSHQYKNHMYCLHQLYLNKLREEKKCVDNAFVIDYINNLEPTRLMYSLNYYIRQINLDNIKTGSVYNCKV